MSAGAIMNASLSPMSEAISLIIEQIYYTARAANDVLIEQESFSKLSGYLVRTVPILKELSRKNSQAPESFNNMTEILEREIKVAKQLVSDCSKRNKFYLLFSSRKIVKRIEETTKEICRAISLIPLLSLDLSSSVQEEISKLCENMDKAEFKAAVAEEEVLQKIESGIRGRNVDRSYANGLLLQIAEAVGIPREGSALKKEFEEFKSEIEDVHIRKDRAEAIQMEQIISLLGMADVASSRREREIKYYEKKNSLGNQPLEPLRPFYCPITQEVMEDPVETLSGQTFERSALEKWLAEGNKNCPLTMIPLDNTTLRPNITLRKSIEEWRDRNTMITIASMRPKLCSDDEQEVLDTLNRLKDLCDERDIHRQWVVLENYIPLLVKFVCGKKPLIRKQALTILWSLAKDNTDNKEIIAATDYAIDYIVRSLSRPIEEGKLAVALLLELSKAGTVLNQIGNAQGCIFLLVTMLNSDQIQAANDASELLENLSSFDQNVVDMAKHNYFKHLLQRLCSGPTGVKIMAEALAEMELTDHSKSILFEGGALKPLLGLISDGDIEAKKVAVKALQNLSTLPSNGLQMIRERAGSLLMELLHLPISAHLSLREQTAATIMNLAVASTSPEAGSVPVTLLESDDDIFWLFSLINLTGPNIQQSVLRTFHALCHPDSAVNMRAKLKQCAAVLVLLCESSNQLVRADAVKLLFSLTRDGNNDDFAEHVGKKCLETLLNIIQASKNEEERTAAMGVLANLPTENSQFTQWLLEVGALPIIARSLTSGYLSVSPQNQRLLENAAGALYRFTMHDDTERQKRAAEAGVISVLVQLLTTGTGLIKQRAANSLAQFSKSSIRLSRQMERRRGFMCFSPPPEMGCPVHGGLCSVETSFCLLEADGVEPLVRLLGDMDLRVCEAALLALATLMEDERLQSGSKVIAHTGGVMPMIRLLSSESAELQEKALRVLERMFRLEEFKREYAAAIQMPLVEITQRGNATTKPLAARTLAHLNVLHDQSSYF